MALAGERSTITGNEFGKSGLAFTDLIIPMVSLVILLFISIFVYFPMITDAIDMRGEIKDTDNKIEELDKKIVEIDEVGSDTSVLKRDLDISKKVIPTSLEVSDFSYYVDRIARDTGLVLEELSSGDISVNNVGYVETREVNENVHGVSGPIVYSGTYTEIVEFLDQLRVRLPYVVEVSNLAMDSGDEDEWEIDLTVTGYYIEDITSDSFNVYQPFSPYTSNESTMNSFLEKTEIFSDFDTETD